MWSDLAAQAQPPRDAEVQQARRVEERVFKRAAHVAVTTPILQDYVLQNYDLSVAKVSVIPNYVLTDEFIPLAGRTVRDRVIFVGRMTAEKNPIALVDACRGLPVELCMVGHGPMRQTVRDMSEYWGVNLKSRSRILHKQLPEFLNTAAVFALVSPHEGHPKALLEAMACGLPVIGADVPGIREVIRHGETGWLCGTSPAEIRAAIQTVLGNSALRTRLGRNARDYIVQNFALEKIVKMELALYEEVLQRKVRPV